MKLNIGCGSNKIAGYINIDTEESCEPDLVHDLMEKPLPFEDGSVDEILFFHCIEHIRKCLHEQVLNEFRRVLVPGGKLYISYPTFWECAQRWHNNTNGEKKFWEATLYGRQLYPTDYHVAAMDPIELHDLLGRLGFSGMFSTPEPAETYNTITFAKRSGVVCDAYEDLIKDDITNMVITQA